MENSELLNRIKFLEEENKILKERIIFLEKNTLKKEDYKSIHHILGIVRSNL